MFLEISQNSQEHTHARVSFLIKLQAWGLSLFFIKKQTLEHVFYCEFCEISKKTFLNRTPLVAGSGIHRIIFWYLLKFLTHLFIDWFIYLLVYLFIFFSQLFI